MNVKISLLFLVAVAVYAKAELEQQYHPQAVLHYLEMEDKKMAEKVRSIVKLPDEDPARPSFRPSRFPTGKPPKVVSGTFTIASWKIAKLQQTMFLAMRRQIREIRDLYKPRGSVILLQTTNCGLRLTVWRYPVCPYLGLKIRGW